MQFIFPRELFSRDSGTFMHQIALLESFKVNNCVFVFVK